MPAILARVEAKFDVTLPDLTTRQDLAGLATKQDVTAVRLEITRLPART